MLELTVAQTRLLSADQDTAQRALRRIVVDTARASTLTAEQRAEWRERAEVWANSAAVEFASDLVALLPEGASEVGWTWPEMHAEMGQVIRHRNFTTLHSSVVL